MPTPKQMFIDPNAVVASLAAKKPIIEVELIEDLGPSAPHDQPALEAAAPDWIPTFPQPKPEPHYTNTLDQLWPHFDDLEERTAARLRLLLGETVTEAKRILTLKEQMWDDLEWFEIADSDRKRFDKEFSAYLRRLNDYREALDDLEPGSTKTDDIHIGLVKRQEGAGPVPDAIMHMYFAKQLGILAEHADDMGEGYIGRVMGALDKVDDAIDDAAEEIHDAAEEKAEKIRELMDDASQQARQDLRRLGMWIGVGVLGTVVVGGAVTAGVLLAARGREE